MTKQCKVCDKIYNQDTQPILCPHLEFPKPCRIHKRLHCGNLECLTQVNGGLENVGNDFSSNFNSIPLSGSKFSF